MRKKNFADKQISGNYFVTVKDNRVTIAPISQFNNAKDAASLPIHFTSCCHPDDNFNIGDGINMCFDRYTNSFITVGQAVRVVDIGKCYPVWTAKIVEFARHNPDLHDDILIKFTFGDTPRDSDTVYTVVDAMETQNDRDESVTVVLIRSNNIYSTNKYFMVNAKGLKVEE